MYRQPRTLHGCFRSRFWREFRQSGRFARRGQVVRPKLDRVDIGRPQPGFKRDFRDRPGVAPPVSCKVTFSVPREDMHCNLGYSRARRGRSRDDIMPPLTKVLFLEMDAGEHTLVRKWAAEGVMPNVQKLL